MNHEETKALALVQSVLLRQPEIQEFVAAWAERIRQIPEAERELKLIEETRVVTEAMLRAGAEDHRAYSLPFAAMQLVKERLAAGDSAGMN